MSDTWQDIAARKQRERADRIPSQWKLPSSHIPAENRTDLLSVPRECGLLSDQERHITENYDASALVVALSSGKFKAVDVTTAFCKRAAIAHQLTNCLTEIFFDGAITRAKQLDEEMAKSGSPTGPLHGLPISLKDTFKVKGYDASIGAAALCFKPADTNSALVDLLLQQGAVLYCKTNIPLTLAALDSHNNVFGRTLNPANTALTAGGSSGGEGALVAMRGSPLGIGTDVGGSIRIPAMCNGLVGVKPSHGRVPYAGQEAGSLPGSSKLGIEATAGPIARTVRDCELLLRVVGDASPWLFDPDVLPHSWTQQLPLLPSPSSHPTRPLRVGVVRNDGHTIPLPPIANLMEELSHHLRHPALPPWQPIEVIDLDLSPLGPKCLKTFNGVMSIDGANYWFDLLAQTGEPLSPWLQNRLKRRPAKSLDQVRDLKAQVSALQTEFLNIFREDGGYWLPSSNSSSSSTDPSSSNHAKQKTKDPRSLDLILCPPAPHPIPPIDRWNTTNYTSLFNLLDLPAGVLPIRPLSPQDLQAEFPPPDEGAPKPLNGWDAINRDLWTKEGDRGVMLDGMLSVQVVAPKLMERRLVEGMRVLEGMLVKGSLGSSEGEVGRRVGRGWKL
ncbi:amidase [Hortaea werneckii]|nr:amidase [Hortaea werneckii]KAI6989378.1 amidase [Hortaea werneckii]